MPRRGRPGEIERVVSVRAMPVVGLAPGANPRHPSPTGPGSRARARRCPRWGRPLSSRRKPFCCYRCPRPLSGTGRRGIQRSGSKGEPAGRRTAALLSAASACDRQRMSTQALSFAEGAWPFLRRRWLAGSGPHQRRCRHSALILQQGRVSDAGVRGQVAERSFQLGRVPCRPVGVFAF